MIQINKLIGLKRRAQRQGWGRWIRSEQDERAVLGGCYFDASRALHIEEFFEKYLVHSKGEYAGKPVTLEVWQRDELVYPLFGWCRLDGMRRFRKAYIEIPKKNGKSLISSAFGLYMLVGDREPGAEVYAAANDRDQARIVHGEAQKMVLASPALANELRILKSKNLIEYPDGQAVFKAITSDPKTQEGLNAHCVIADEMHEWQGRELYNCLRYAFAARREPMFIMITTAGDNLDSVCYEEHQYAASVADGTIWAPEYFPYIRTVSDPNCSILDEKEWYRANPNLGVTMPVEGFRLEAHESARTRTGEAAFRRYRLNIWTAAGTKWMDHREWAACRFDLLT